MDGENHPALPSSLREGPRVKPFTQQQIYKMVMTLEGMRTKYKDNQQIVNILTSYINDCWSIKPDDDQEMAA